VIDGIERITVTGADEQTDIAQLAALAERRHVEVGLLYTVNPEGRNRYPSREWLKAAVDALGRRAALHVCGRPARAQLLDGSLDDLAQAVGRVQVNGILSLAEAAAIAARVPVLITQHNAENHHLLDLPAQNHELLVDASGGTGRSPSHWIGPRTAKPVGFAGGLGPYNLAGELPRIAQVATARAWIDMETSLRGDDDWFSGVLAAAAIVAFERFAGLLNGREKSGRIGGG